MKDGSFKHHDSEKGDLCTKESLLEQLEVALNSASILDSLSFDEDINESVENEFLNKLGGAHSAFSSSSESEPESPRERLLRQFEKETQASGLLPLFDFETNNAKPTAIIKERAKVIENLETEALMREWGVNEKTFQCSPPEKSGGFKFPASEASLELPSLGEGLGPFIQTKNGGFLRSMNPSLFKNGKNGGSLIMQVSSPVVVPAEMGFGTMEILKRLASLGIEELSVQANKVMPLDDITGKTMHQVARQRFLSCDSSNNVKYSEYVSLEDLAPLAMDKIEEISIEGLRIQSGMTDEEAPNSVIHAQDAAGLNLLDSKNNGVDTNGLLGMSLSLDEWMRFDSGVFGGNDDRISERTSRVLAAHHANSVNFIRRGKRGKKFGLLGNNFTVALMVQLRDPLRNYEPVGAPMLALIQVERVFMLQKPKIFRKVWNFKCNSEDDAEFESAKEEEGLSPQFSITEVQISGMNPEPAKKVTQTQSGSRWLIANGMGKGKRISKFSTSEASKVEKCDSLWSVASRLCGVGAKWKGLEMVKTQIRNPNIVFSGGYAGFLR